jgi:hypothetical protein
VRQLKVGIVDLVTKAPDSSLYGRVMFANLASIMPQVVATWCERQGHQVFFVCYTGREDLLADLPDDLDLVFIGAFTEAALLAYALSRQFQSRGAATVLGGPHARCYPEDAVKYFDYVLGFTDEQLIQDVLQDCSRHRPLGMQLASSKQPETLPGVRERWKFIEATLRKAPFFKIVSMLGSLGCPYTCSFCIDATVPYQPLNFDVIKDDLRFLLEVQRRPHVGWHDPNFGVRFDDYMGAIEEAVPRGRIDFLAESSLSLLSESHLKRLEQNGFKVILPGIESWFDLGNKSKTGTRTGMEKVERVAEHVNLILRYIPYVQTNFVLGLDVDAGSEPFELTKRFLDLTPGAFPGYSLLSAFGRASPLNRTFQQEGRVLPFPFHFLDNNQSMNVRPANYSWPEFYDHLIDLCRYSFSYRAIYRRFRSNREWIPRWMNVVRAVSSEGFGRIKYHTEIRRRLDADPEFLPFFNQERTTVPRFYAERIRKELGDQWESLPVGAIDHDPNAYLNSGAPATWPAVATGSIGKLAAELA